MKKLILLASIALAVVVYQPVKAQVSVNINIGTRPYYTPSYYSYGYVPVRHVYPYREVVVHRPVYVPTRVYRSYSRPSTSYYVEKNYKKHGKGHFKGNGRGRHK